MRGACGVEVREEDRSATVDRGYIYEGWECRIGDGLEDNNEVGEQG